MRRGYCATLTVANLATNNTLGIRVSRGSEPLIALALVAKGGYIRLVARQQLANRLQFGGQEMHQEGRLWVRLISTQALRQYMDFRGETNASLAGKAGLRRGIVGHLRSGKRTSCSPRTARSIEQALNAPPGSLFLAEVAIGSTATGRAA